MWWYTNFRGYRVCLITDFQKNSNEYGIYEWSERTDWRSVATDLNIVKDFTGKWRAEWWPFWFVASYLKKTDHETFLWFEEKYPNNKPVKVSALSILILITTAWPKM